MDNPKLPEQGSIDENSCRNLTSNSCAICGNPVQEGIHECKDCSYIRRTSSTPILKPNLVQVLPKNRTRATKSQSRTAWAFVAIAMVGASLPIISKKLNSQARTEAISYGDALQALVDDLDSRLQSNVFGGVTAVGGEAIVVLDNDYFSRMSPKTQRFMLENIRDQWFAKCYGTKIIFKAWDGSIVAQY